MAEVPTVQYNSGTTSGQTFTVPYTFHTPEFVLRRLAFETAAKVISEGRPESIIEAAEKFEAYLRGEAAEREEH